MAIHSGQCLCLRCQYHANVMKMFEATSRTISLRVRSIAVHISAGHSLRVDHVRETERPDRQILDDAAKRSGPGERRSHEGCGHHVEAGMRCRFCHHPLTEDYWTHC